MYRPPQGTKQKNNPMSTTGEKNILLALFTGWTPTGKKHPFNPELGNTYRKTREINGNECAMGVSWGAKFDFHRNWSSLMKVVIHIESMGYPVNIEGRACTINYNTFVSEQSKIHAVWESCVKFIELQKPL